MLFLLHSRVRVAYDGLDLQVHVSFLPVPFGCCVSPFVGSICKPFVM